MLEIYELLAYNFPVAFATVFSFSHLSYLKHMKKRCAMWTLSGNVVSMFNVVQVYFYSCITFLAPQEGIREGITNHWSL